MKETKLEIIGFTNEDVVSTSGHTGRLHFVVEDANDDAKETGKLLRYSATNKEWTDVTSEYNPGTEIGSGSIIGRPGATTFQIELPGAEIDDMYEFDGTTWKICKESHGEVVDCLAKGTKITMADGSIKNIEDIKEKDLILTYNHKEGKYEGQKVYLAWKADETKKPFTLHFEGDVNISVIGDHNFFEKESLSYVAIFEDKAEEFVGKHFYNAKLNNYVKLLSVTHEAEAVEYYEIYTEHNANCIAEDMLNCPYDSSEILNIFKFKEDLTIDHEQLDKDIREFGIFEYKENSRYPKELYDALNWKYVNVIIGKGFGTMEDFEVRLDEFLKLR